MRVCYPKTNILFDRCLSEFDPLLIKTNMSNKIAKINPTLSDQFQISIKKSKKTRGEI